MTTLRIRWAPKVRRHKINRLYQNDALGILDEDLVAEVGFDLFQRCRSILMVTAGDRVDCPACGAEVISVNGRWSRANPITCSACGWKATYGQYRDSWRHQDLKGGNAVAFFFAFVEQYPRAGTPRERILLIDRLIHTFHWSARHQRSHGPVGVQLIDGGLEEVMAFLDRLTFGSESTPELRESAEAWRSTLDKVAETFAFVREKLPPKTSPQADEKSGE